LVGDEGVMREFLVQGSLRCHAPPQRRPCDGAPQYSAVLRGPGAGRALSRMTTQAPLEPVIPNP
jgi:hypothetical protein